MTKNIQKLLPWWVSAGKAPTSYGFQSWKNKKCTLFIRLELETPWCSLATFAFFNTHARCHVFVEPNLEFKIEPHRSAELTHAFRGLFFLLRRARALTGVAACFLHVCLNCRDALPALLLSCKDIWLVVSTPLKNMKVSWDDYSSYTEKIIQSCSSDHQPVIVDCLWKRVYFSKAKRFFGAFLGS